MTILSVFAFSLLEFFIFLSLHLNIMILADGDKRNSIWSFLERSQGGNTSDVCDVFKGCILVSEIAC